MPIYNIIPHDVLFFRDARPMTADAGSGGHGARWPSPSLFFDAVHAALHRAFPAANVSIFQDWEHAHDFGRSSTRPYKGDRSKRFGSLATAGPFPRVEDEAQKPRWLFPCPADVLAAQELKCSLAPLRDDDSRGRRTNLPNEWLRPLGRVVQSSKAAPPEWWSKEAIEGYLRGDAPSGGETWRTEELFDSEWNTGIAIDPETQTTGAGAAKGRIYAAEYLRLRPDVSFGACGSMPLKKCNGEEGLTRLFNGNGRVFIFGGQQRTCSVAEESHSSLATLLPISQPIAGNRVKWLLLSPAIFPAIEPDPERGIDRHPGGWLPNWIDPETGGVLLKKGDATRLEGESRQDWRSRVRNLDRIDCHLVAACVPKPLVLTGWSDYLHLGDSAEPERGKGAKPTLLAVPAGAAYYFEGDDADSLVDALSWHGMERPNTASIVNRRSTLRGEKGFGLGVCGTWNFYEDVVRRPENISSLPRALN